MSIVYVGLDLGSSNFQQVALNHDGVSRVNRDFTTSESQSGPSLLASEG